MPFDSVTKSGRVRRRTMSADARKADIKASHVQKAVAKAGVALADSTQALLRAAGRG